MATENHTTATPVAKKQELINSLEQLTSQQKAYVWLFICHLGNINGEAMA